MTFLTSCFNQLAESPSFSRLRRSIVGGTIQRPKSPIAGPRYPPLSPQPSTLPSPVFARPRSPFSPNSGMASYSFRESNDREESEPLLDQTGSPSIAAFSNSLSLMSTSSVPPPGEMRIVKSASSEIPFGLIHAPINANISGTLPLLVTPVIKNGSSRTHRPPHSDSGHRLDFSPDAFNLDQYDVDKYEASAAATQRILNPPALEERVTSDTPTVYYTMNDPDSPSSKQSKSQSSLGRSSVMQEVDKHQAYLQNLKLLQFGEGGQEEYTVLEFSFGAMAENADEDSMSWEDLDISSYDWA